MLGNLSLGRGSSLPAALSSPTSRCPPQQTMYAAPRPATTPSARLISAFLQLPAPQEASGDHSFRDGAFRDGRCFQGRTVLSGTGNWSHAFSLLGTVLSGTDGAFRDGRCFQGRTVLSGTGNWSHAFSPLCQSSHRQLVTQCGLITGILCQSSIRAPDVSPPKDRSRPPLLKGFPGQPTFFFRESQSPAPMPYDGLRSVQARTCIFSMKYSPRGGRRATH